MPKDGELTSPATHPRYQSDVVEQLQDGRDQGGHVSQGGCVEYCIDPALFLLPDNDSCIYQEAFSAGRSVKLNR